MYNIILDAMGGDNAPNATVQGALSAVSEFSDIHVDLVGKEEVLMQMLEGLEYDKSRIDVVNATQEIEMAEPPVKAIRTKTDSSMVVGLKMAAEGKGDVFITAGSTGAAVAGGTLLVRRVQNVLRPALAPVLPTAKGGMLLIDCGANVDCKPAYLAQFGVMGSIYMQTVMGVKNPRVGLINNGAEEEKGNALTKEAYQLLKKSNINFIGNVEGRDMLEGVCDVAVCDGFVGNVVMKFMEGCAKFFSNMIKEELLTTMRTKFGAVLAKPAFKSFKKKMDYSEYGGALLLGTNAGVIKAHGSSDAKTIKNTIIQARGFAERGVVSLIKQRLAEFDEDMLKEE